MERIQKILAKAGIASRRKCEELIKQGKVEVNGKKANIGEQASETDDIRIDGKKVKIEKKKYIILNKPKGYVTTTRETHGMKTVMDLINTEERVYPVGRLDKNSEGLLILTNDGELANKMTHPGYNIKKEYYVETDKKIQPIAAKLKKGTKIEGRNVEVSNLTVKDKTAILEIHEGRKHIVRKLFRHYGMPVKRLIRLRTGSLKLGKLKLGETRELTKEEISKLKHL